MISKILCKLGIHKKGKLISEHQVNVWGQGWDLIECKRCGEWYFELIHSYFDKALYEGTKEFLKDIKSNIDK